MPKVVSFFFCENIRHQACPLIPSRLCSFNSSSGVQCQRRKIVCTLRRLKRDTHNTRLPALLTNQDIHDTSIYVRRYRCVSTCIIIVRRRAYRSSSYSCVPGRCRSNENIVRWYRVAVSGVWYRLKCIQQQYLPGTSKSACSYTMTTTRNCGVCTKADLFTQQHNGVWQ